MIFVFVFLLYLFSYNYRRCRHRHCYYRHCYQHRQYYFTNVVIHVLFPQQLAVPRADEWSRLQNTLQDIQANASSSVSETIGSPRMSPSKSSPFV